MRIPTFIGATSVLLAGWLGVAFFRDVPTGSYPLIENSLAGGARSGAVDARLVTQVDAPNEP